MNIGDEATEESPIVLHLNWGILQSNAKASLLLNDGIRQRKETK